MATRIWKWPLQILNEQTLNLPIGALWLDVQMQGGEPHIWCLCDANAPLEPRRLAIHGTGNPMPDDPGEYLATFQTGAFVWHLFEVFDTPTIEQRNEA
jgi:hypothetical protein